MRANSLTNLGVALDYNVASDYDKVLVLSGIASEIEELAPHANEIATLVANLPDVLTVQQAVDVLNNLTVSVTTLMPGAEATSELVGTEIRLGIPAGTQGVQGIQGSKGDKGDKGDIGLTGAQGPTGATGPQGPRGFRGEDGLDGEGVVITSILNNINKSLTINFSDGTQHTTDPLKGEDGRSVTITNVVNNANGTMLINFSDGTSHHTADLRGVQGPKGDTGDNVHHVSYQRSKDPLGNEVGPTEPGRPGYGDTYAMWASQEELPEMYIGEFTVYNGLNTLTAEEQVKFDSIEFGATADQEAFEVPYDNSISGLLSEDVQNSIDELSATKLNLIEKGHPNGVASLDSNGLVPSTQLPSYVDDVLEYARYAELPVTGETGKIYVVIADETSGDDTSSYRWTGTIYAMVSNTLTVSDVKALYEANPDTNEYSDAEKVLVDVGQVLETTATTLPTAINELVDVKVDKIVGSSLVPDTKVSLYDSHIIDTANPHAVTKAQVGLSNADNTSDNVKNVLSATKWTTSRTITLSGDVAGSVIVDGSTNVTITTTVQPNSVALGTDTTGNYMANVTAGSGISVSHTQGEGSTATITNSAPNVTTNITTTHNNTSVVVNSSDGTDGTINSATQTLAGVMSAADKTKLDGIEVGATGDQTANEILTSLKTVAGSGSGLDADLLDGQEGAYYLNASNINAGTIDDTRLPATITSSTIGNASTATKLATPRTINGVAFDGTANIIAPTNLGITAGTTAGPIVTSSTGTNATLPTASTTASGVVTTGNQTIAGIKTFSSSPIVPVPILGGEAVNKDYVDDKYSGFKNYIINGNFDIWQRGVSQTTSAYESDDRWANAHAGSTKTHTQVACTDTERVLFNADYFSRTVVTSVAGANNYITKDHKIENITKLAGKTVTLSFWAKADSNKNISVAFNQWFGTGGTPSSYINGIGTQLVALTTTWQRKTITVTLPSIIGKTLGTHGVNTTYTGLQFFFDAGSNLNSFTASLGQQSGTFDIAQVQIEEGSVATPFEQRPIGLELSLCERYYQSGIEVQWSGNITTGISYTAITMLPVVMRQTPTATYTSVRGLTNFMQPTVVLIGESRFGCTAVAGASSSGQWDVLYNLSAEL